MIIEVAILAAALLLVALLYVLHRQSVSMLQAMRETVEQNTKLAETSMLYLKAQGVDQVTSAQLAKSNHEVQIQQMKDALAKNVADEEVARQAEIEWKAEPQIRETTDGRQIDLREWDPV